MNPFSADGDATRPAPLSGAIASFLVLAFTIGLSLSFGGSEVAAKKPRALLPNLRPIAPQQLIGPQTRVEPTLGVDAPYMIDGCFTDEKLRKGAERCLRYDGRVANFGSGPLELHYRADAHLSLVSAYQRIHHKDGSFKDRFATESEFHPTHAHFHVRDFYIARLWRTTSKGRKLGAKPVAVGDKNGFCPEDSSYVGTGGTTSPDRYSCLTENEPGAGPPSLQVVGISAGWMDIYGATLPDQFVEISGIKDGSYILELELDPNNVFKESNENDNVVCTVIYLDGQSASSTRTVPCR